MTAERQFEAAAKGDTLDRGHHRDRHVLDCRNHNPQVRLLSRLAELGDVGAAAECPCGAGQHDGAKPALAPQLRQRIHQPGPQREAERVDRRIVHVDDGDVAVTLHAHDHE